MEVRAQISDRSTQQDDAVLARCEKSSPVRAQSLAHVSHDDAEHADKVLIKGLEVYANHGVFPEENSLGQKFVISATLFCDTSLAGRTDDLSYALDYGAICHEIDAFTRNHTYKLLERLAEELVQHLLDAHDSLLGIRLGIEKPWAPVGLPLSSVGVEIERLR